jgi:hypothetical protein
MMGIDWWRKSSQHCQLKDLHGMRMATLTCYKANGEE